MELAGAEVDSFDSVQALWETLRKRASTEADVARFRHWHVEPLLMASAEILDRCVAHVLRLEGLLLAELTRRVEDLRVENERHEAELAYGEGASNGYYYLEQQIEAKVLEQIKAEAVLWDTAKVKHDAWYYDKDEPETPRQTAKEMTLAIFAQQMWRFTGEVQLANMRAERAEHDAAPKRSIGRKYGLQVAVKQLRDRAREDNGALNHEEQIKRTEKLLLRDYDEAMSRIHAAVKGLALIYGFSTKETDRFGSQALEKLVATTGDAVVSAITLVRNALAWLAAFSTGDQAFTCSFSVSELCTAADMDDLRAGRPVKFSLPPAWFAKHYYVRVKGVSASHTSDSGATDGIVQISMVPPSKGSVRWSALNGGVLDQGDVPPCILGRVCHLMSPQSPEITGGASWMNISPLGAMDSKWMIQITRATNAQVSETKDLIIDLRCSGRPAVALGLPILDLAYVPE